MALQRARSTLSMMQRKATKYQKYLNLSNVFLLITSTILIFTTVILMKFYHVDKLDFWSVYCWLVPVFMITLGVYTFLVCIFGFVISGSENRPMIAGYAVLLAIAFLAQLGSIFTAMELRTDVDKDQVPSSAITEELNKVRFLKASGGESSNIKFHGNLKCDHSCHWSFETPRL